MKLATQVALGLALLLLLTSGLAVWQLTLIERLHEANKQMAATDLEVSRSSLGMRLEIDRLSSLTQRFFVLRDPGYRGELDRVRAQLAEDVGALTALPIPDQELASVLDDWREYLRQAGAIEPMVPIGTEPADGRDRLLSALNQIRQEVAGLDAAALERVSQRIERSREQASDARRSALLVVTAGLALALLLAVWIQRFTVRPLHSLSAGANAIAAGEFDYRVAVEGSSEVESLAGDFNQMAQRLGEVDRMKRDFVSSVSHDLKAPLASMQEVTRLLLEDESLDDGQRRLIELNAQSAERLQRMIADLLDVAQLEAGAVALDLQPIDLEVACHEVLSEAQGLLEAGEIRIDIEASGTPPVVRADPVLLHKAVWNLLSNAIKFSPEGGTIRLHLQSVTSTEDGSSRWSADSDLALPAAALTIADQGPGIPDEDKGRIFERFYRSRKHERYASGTGLGLAITRAIVEQHGGRVWVEDAPAGGTLFAVLLPMESTDEPMESTGGAPA